MLVRPLQQQTDPLLQFRSATGSLLWLLNMSPEISSALNLTAEGNCGLQEHHKCILKRIAAYLQDTE